MNKKHISLISLVLGYILSICFIILITLNIPKKDNHVIAYTENTDKDLNTTVTHKEVIHTRYIDTNPVNYVDHLDGIVLNETTTRHTAVVHDDIISGVDVGQLHTSNNYNHGISTHRSNHNNRHHVGNELNDNHHVRTAPVVDHVKIPHTVSTEVDLLDKRLRDLDREQYSLEEDTGGIDLSKLTVVDSDDEAELGDVDFDIDFNSDGTGTGGQLYAYGLPSQGVGAGIGSSTVGAGSGASAGISAGVGEGTSSGSTVPTLGGVGTYIASDKSTGGGVGGLVGGAGAGGAAGLYVGDVSSQLGTGSGIGGTGKTRDYNFEHLPKNGALHIMIHVDGSGSLLSTRGKLDEMKETLLKKALLPYYNDDVSLYNKRVTIVDSSGERSLQFFNQAAKKDNVLAIAFQDEAAPDYHLPNFNKVPQSAYSSDLGKLKTSLNSYKGLYRGIMFQVDRGRTFSTSFKEMMECAFNGEGYLHKENLKRYHRDDNQALIKTKRGVVFSDEYHARSEDSPEYYLELIFTAAKKIGLDLNSHSSGLSDGRHYNK